MKRYILAAACTLSFVISNAQQFYIKGGLGYAVPQAGQTLDGSSTPYNGSITNSGGNTLFSIKGGASFSAGLSGTIGGGYMFNDHVGVELDLITGLAPKKYTNYDYNDTLSSVPSNISTVQYTRTSLLLAPQLVVQTGGKIWNIYARGGVVLPLIPAQIRQEITITSAASNVGLEDYVYTLDTKTSFSLGITAAIGTQYNLTDNVCIWGELNMLSMSLYAKEQDWVSATGNGQTLQPPSGPATTYSKNVTYTSGGSTFPTYSIPFSNIGIHAGVMYRFDKKAKTKSNARPHSHGRNEF